MRTPRTILVAFCLLSPAFAQGITMVQGSSTTSLDVVVLDENQPSLTGTTLLQGIELMPVEMTGRYASQELRADVARRIELNGFTRIELPGSARVFEYRRLGGQFWGFLLVPADGQARVVLERPGTASQGSPFASMIGVAADGRHMVVPVGGGCYVVNLDGTVFPSSQAPARLVNLPGGMVPLSVTVGASAVFFTGDQDTIWRLPLADGSTPTNLTPPGSGFRFKDELAISGDGTTIAFLYGASNTQLQIYTADSTSATARLLPPPPAKYEEPGYLPGASGNLRLMLDEHATRLFYIDATIRDESFLMDLATSQPLPPVQITQDNIFQPYIGVHILPTFIGDKLLVSIGDLATVGTAMEWYKVELAPTGATVTNLTSTAQAPFPAGNLSPVSATVIGGLLVEADATPTGLALRTIDPANTTAPVVQTITEAPVIGSSQTNKADFLARGAVDGIYDGASMSPIGFSPLGTQLTPPVHAAGYSATWLHLPNNWGTIILYFPGGAISGGIELGVEQIVLTQRGNMVIKGNPTRFLSYRSIQPLNLPSAPVRVFLSGAGG